MLLLITMYSSGLQCMTDDFTDYVYAVSSIKGLSCALRMILNKRDVPYLCRGTVYQYEHLLYTGSVTKGLLRIYLLSFQNYMNVLCPLLYVYIQNCVPEKTKVNKLLQEDTFQEGLILS